jgi:hypothetical protein
VLWISKTVITRACTQPITVNEVDVEWRLVRLLSLLDRYRLYQGRQRTLAVSPTEMHARPRAGASSSLYGRSRPARSPIPWSQSCRHLSIALSDSCRCNLCCTRLILALCNCTLLSDRILSLALVASRVRERVIEYSLTRACLVPLPAIFVESVDPNIHSHDAYGLEGWLVKSERLAERSTRVDAWPLV